MAFGDELAAQRPGYAKKYLELITLFRNPVAVEQPSGRVDELRVVCRDSDPGIAVCE